MKIAVDIDNTLCTTTQAVCDHYNEYTGEHLTIDDIIKYHIEDCVNPKYSKLINTLFHDANAWKRIEVIPQCQEILKLLVDSGHKVYYATSTTSKNLNAKRKWLQANFPFIDSEKQLIAIKNKQLLNVDILIDDCSAYMEGGNYKGILIDYPWNRDFKCDEIHNFRVMSWMQIYTKIQRLETIDKIKSTYTNNED